MTFVCDSNSSVVCKQLWNQIYYVLPVFLPQNYLFKENVFYIWSWLYVNKIACILELLTEQQQERDLLTCARSVMYRVQQRNVQGQLGPTRWLWVHNREQGHFRQMDFGGFKQHTRVIQKSQNIGFKETQGEIELKMPYSYIGFSAVLL